MHSHVVGEPFPGFSCAGYPSAGASHVSAGVLYPSAGAQDPFLAVLHPSVEVQHQHDVILHPFAEFLPIEQWYYNTN